MTSSLAPSIASGEERNRFADPEMLRVNNFNILRLALATLVIFSHSFPLLYGDDKREPLMLFSDGRVNFGTVAVDCFFAISGFLIVNSWLHSRDFLSYLRKRFLRIYPGFLVAASIGVLVVGPWSAKDFGSYFAGFNLFEFLSSLLFLRDYRVFGAFPHHPNSQVVNGSLWSIQYEFWCYLLVACFGILGFYKNRAVAVALFLGALAFYGAQQHLHLPLLFPAADFCFGRLPEWPRLWSFFFAGVAFYQMRDAIPYRRSLALGCLLVVAVSLKTGTLVHFALPIFGTYLLFYASFNCTWRMPEFGRRVDLSYGTYLYAFPVQQILIQLLGRNMHPFTLFVLATPISYGCAFLSWHGIEKRWLKRKLGRAISA